MAALTRRSTPPRAEEPPAMLISTTASPAGTYTVEDDGILGNGKGRIRGPGLLTEFAYPFGGSVEFDSGPGQKCLMYATPPKRSPLTTIKTRVTNAKVAVTQMLPVAVPPR